MRAFEASFEQASMFRDATAHSFAPKPEAGRLQLAPHDFDDLALYQSGTFFDFLKGRPVFPSESDDTGNLLW
jgi:hypothetical protein